MYLKEYPGVSIAMVFFISVVSYSVRDLQEVCSLASKLVPDTPARYDLLFDAVLMPLNTRK